MLTSHPVQKPAATKRLLGGAAIRCVVVHCCANSNALLQGRYGSTAGAYRACTRYGRSRISTNPLHIMPIGQGQYSKGQSFPANAKRNTTRVRKRPMKENSVVPDMSRVMLAKGKRVNTRGSEALVTWGVQFNRETLLEDTQYFHGWITFTV